MKDRTKRQEAQRTVEPSQLQMYLQKQIGNYIAHLRGTTPQSDIAKKAELNVRTLHSLENGKTDFQLSTLLRVLTALKGDFTEAFRSRVPKKLHTEHWLLHEQLQLVLEEGRASEKEMVETALSLVTAAIQARQSPADESAEHESDRKAGHKGPRQ